ncbi:ABC transporter ATP-binding protein [Sedimenticola selenatireducens]|uniref:ABC transporter ATP-binding protein n=1 Tax=Sedimenticola selenatireducens TaxID=191960 RepID=A0A2N6CT63_9GAMM|nr:ABC transporter ATP-binding protein [Sedimenticola selenatireducens]PLX60316.1 MAG: ABC transporter ATP-binding protein [Sedimenticola selenatireducens]
MTTIISISNLCKTYENGYQALKRVNLDIREGEILALLGPNGAGKTTLISVICGLVSPTSGTVSVAGFDIIKDYRQTRRRIGLVPQELTLAAFDKVWDTLCFSRGLFGKKADNAYLEQLLKDLSLWDKRNGELRTLSGGMKRRVLIAKALSHQPKILFLDEPTAGVDVELRKDMWRIVNRLRDSGVTIILTTHYIEEAEQIADRVGVINNGELLLVDDKANLMQELGRKQMIIELKEPLKEIPESMASYALELSDDGHELIFTYDTQGKSTGITALLQAMHSAGISMKDLNTTQSSLQDIFVNLVQAQP